ncbi:MAG: hypothetical protein K2W78_00275 [Xanthobacteraceae bacterium]|nr:hypothetical protein [Xanthobacteraceae bacterium]
MDECHDPVDHFIFCFARIYLTCFGGSCITATSYAHKKTTAKRSQSKASTPSQTGPCIGVLPVIGDTFGVKEVGVTVFGNKYTEIPIASWALDDLVVARVRAASPRGFVVKRIPFAVSAFDPFYKPRRALFPEPGTDLVDIVRRVASSSGCARYVVVTKWDSRFGSTNQSVRGIGLVHAGGLFAKTTLLFAITRAVVYDQNFTPLKEALIQIDDRSILARSLDIVPGPTCELDDYAWPDQPAAADTPTNKEIA